MKKVIIGLSVLFLLSMQVACGKGPGPSPWSDVKVYTHNNSVIKAYVGTEFAIGLIDSPSTGNGYYATIDKSMVIEVAEDIVGENTKALMNVPHWFLFKAVNPGKTEIVFNKGFSGIQQVFSVEIKYPSK